MFLLKQKVVYPGHGVAEISKIFERKFGAITTVFCELKFLNKDMTVMVAVDKAQEVGIRPLSSTETINDIFETLIQPARKISPQELTASNWSRRNKGYQNKLRNGSLKEISEIYRDLKHISKQKELSFGEKSLLSKAETLLAEEISAVENLEEDKAIGRLRSIFMPVTLSQYQHAF